MYPGLYSQGLSYFPFRHLLMRDVTNEDIDKLLALPVRRIARFDIEKNQQELRDIAAKIKETIDLDPRVTVLGHIQRGGYPTGRDRVNETKMGYLAVEMLLQGKTNRITL